MISSLHCLWHFNTYSMPIQDCLDASRTLCHLQNHHQAPKMHFGLVQLVGTESLPRWTIVPNDYFLSPDRDL